ncbi:hypothetical protein LB559_25935 [Mesorhizobium sp. BR1-1-3]|uniref:hypothetical protein n=1 Tax=Mesorhizobium sp. BR1-1-3 TaxID=2876651 RepID=UPI001CD0FDFB|nr:hypothetical protein [Mesorhizobium sp. BR1-1-3]MBZ9891374.1 hypothetical protein [Mesorhizobium sp. BR1-1-3]
MAGERSPVTAKKGLLVRKWWFVPIVLMSMASTIGAQAAEKFPPFWRKAMTNDPSTNYFLKKYSAPLDDPAGTAVRNIMLARVVGAECQASRLNKAKIKAYRDRMIGPLTPEQLKTAAFEGGSALRSFNYQDLAHLCAGIDYQFGPKGVLIPGAVLAGKGEPKYPFDPRNPYFRLPEFTGD